MLYSNSLIKVGECALSQVTANNARKLFMKGKVIHLHPCNLRIPNFWQNPIPINPNDTKYEGDYNNDKGLLFDSLVNEFMCYNCDSERGKRVLYFMDMHQPHK